MDAKVNSISVNGVEYVEKGSVVPVEYTGDIKIVILQRGWVMLGRFERNGNDCKLHNSYVVRRWGTTKGLGELAERCDEDAQGDPGSGMSSLQRSAG